MKKILALSLLLGTALLMARCSNKAHKTLATNTKTPASEVAELKRNYSAEKMEQGKTLFEANCAKCHKLHVPETRTVAQWDNILPNMSNRAKLNDEQTGLVRAYVVSNAKVN